MAARKPGKSTEKNAKAAAGCDECKCQAAEGNFAIAAAILVIFSAMIKPEYSVGLSVLMLVLFAVYKKMMADGTWPCRECK